MSPNLEFYDPVDIPPLAVFFYKNRPPIDRKIQA